MGFHISRRSQGKDPLNARFANPIGHCDSQAGSTVDLDDIEARLG